MPSCVTIMCRNDELSLIMSWLFNNRFRATRYMKIKENGNNRNFEKYLGYFLQIR